MVDHGQARGGASAGLVSSHTSGTQVGLIEIDPFLTRLRRLRRAVLTKARMHEFELRHQRHKPALVTLTYREVGDWQPHHISDLLQRIRVWLRRRGHRFRYVWVAELQRRGALHYHVLAWLPRGLTLPETRQAGMVDPWINTNRMGTQARWISCEVREQARLKGGTRIPSRSQAARMRRARRIWTCGFAMVSTCPTGPERSSTWVAEQCASKAWDWSIARVGYACRRHGGCPGITPEHFARRRRGATWEKSET